ncbi:hypothetical protein [Hymenobacter convexus]|uniref:hypothetical protein n=1 Tax=Hymenobacter sp. CA1UV-4 TaxID=3063782 RepID=UPI00272A127D|nr:hypothetical protein [Hymenobacter sp. CA1UV-4]
MLIALILSVGYYKYHQWHQNEAIRAALEYGRLAPLPDSATDVQVDTEGSMFSRTFWLCFKTNRTTIDKWVAKSSSLSKQPSVELSTADFPVIDAPSWFSPQIITRGKKFDIPSNEDELYGTVWIDYASGTVYIKTSHS